MSQTSDARIERFHAWMRRVPHWLLSVVCLALVLWLTLAPHPMGDTEIPLFEGADKIGHGLMFFALTVSMLFDAQRARGWRALPLPLVALVAFIGMGMGIGIEFIQRAMDVGRSWEFLDMVADSFGAIAAGSLWIFAGGWFDLTRNEIEKIEKEKESNDKKS